MAFLCRLRNGGVFVSTSARFPSFLALLVFATACGGGESPPPAEEAQPAAEEPSAPSPATEMELPEGVTAAMVAQGESIFTGTGICYTCHMAGGVGGPLAPNLTDEEWSAIGHETFVLWTSHDPTADDTVGKRIASLIPNARYECMQNCGHWPQFEDPPTFNRLHIDFFLNGN